MCVHACVCLCLCVSLTAKQGQIVYISGIECTQEWILDSRSIPGSLRMQHFLHAAPKDDAIMPVICGRAETLWISFAEWRELGRPPDGAPQGPEGKGNTARLALHPSLRIQDEKEIGEHKVISTAVIERTRHLVVPNSRNCRIPGIRAGYSRRQ